MTASAVAEPRVRLRAVRSTDIPALVEFWNQSFRERRGFLPLTEDIFRRRILTCGAYDAGGLILAWREDDSGNESIVGLVHAFRPPPDTAVYQRWGRYHTIAVLYVEPSQRQQGVGSRLLRAAENWLYYCPVHFAGQSVPCYGNVEGPQQPLFGSTQRMGVNAYDRELLRFLANRGYAVVDPGDVSMSAELRNRRRPSTAHADLSGYGLRLLRVGNASPFLGNEPTNRQEYASWSRDFDRPYAALILVDEADMLRGHMCWYPLHTDSAREATAAIYGFWLAPPLRGNGLGSLLLDTALEEMAKASRLGSRFERVEVQTHLTRHADAVALYESRGFTIDDAWVTLVKT